LGASFLTLVAGAHTTSLTSSNPFWHLSPFTTSPTVSNTPRAVWGGGWIPPPGSAVYATCLDAVWRPHVVCVSAGA
jgi:hypothetical protein